MLKIVNNVLGFLAILAQIFLIVTDLFWIFWRGKMREIIKWFPQNLGFYLAFLVATIATLGSFFYSQIAKFVPCELCWFQRIFMYPQVILLGLAISRKDKKIIDYSLALALIGAAISLYHNYIIYFPSVSSFCSTGTNSTCTRLVIISFSYISIPLMALSAFLLIISALFWQKTADKIR